MEKLDRLGWADGIAFSCHGARIGIRVNDSSVLQRLSGYLPPGREASPSPAVDSLYSLYVAGKRRPNVLSYNLLYAGSTRVARTTELDEIFDTLESALHVNVSVGARDRIFVHAGVVGWRGQAIVIPGRSMSGKTTLVAELVRVGATYYSDEFAVFDARGHVHPYARPLMVRKEAHGPQTRWPVESLGGRAGTEPLPVGLVVLTEFAAGARWLPSVLTPGQALLSLMEHTVLARVRPEAALKFLKPVALSSTVLKGNRGDARETAKWLLNEASAPRRAA
jgi:hypothetical protein